MPNSAVYYIAPLQKQARELIWANNRLQNFFKPKVDPVTKRTHKGHTESESAQIYAELCEKYGVKYNNTEMRISFSNGSFIKLDGSDQYEAYRGINPHLMLYDEFKDHHPKFHIGMDPNLATHQAPLVIVGTPPVGEDTNEKQFIELADDFSQEEDASYYNYTSYSNPHISKEWLDKKKEELYRRSRGDEWEREYMARRIKAGSRAMFPMLEYPRPKEGIYHTRHCRPHAEILNLLQKRHKDWEYFLGFDPGSTSTFGVLLGAFNSFTRQGVWIDCIYEKKKEEMTTRKIYPKALELLQGLPVLEEDVRKLYDHAAAWFNNEVIDNFDEALEPCSKDIKKDKMANVRLIGDMLIYGYWVASEKCGPLFEEMKNYRTDEEGKLPKKNDHLIDIERYILNAANYTMVPDAPLGQETFRSVSMENEFKSGFKKRGEVTWDLADRLTGEYYG